MATIARTIIEQATTRALMSLGAHALIPMDQAIVFTALILPFRKDGSRSERRRRMQVRIDLTAADDYTITVTYTRGLEQHTHFRREGVYCDQLAATLLALDYDGDATLNPHCAI